MKQIQTTHKDGRKKIMTPKEFTDTLLNGEHDITNYEVIKSD